MPNPYLARCRCGQQSCPACRYASLNDPRLVQLERAFRRSGRPVTALRRTPLRVAFDTVIALQMAGWCLTFTLAGSPLGHTLAGVLAACSVLTLVATAFLAVPGQGIRLTRRARRRR
jgi:hypothetical protein